MVLLKSEYSPSVVVLSFGISLLGSYLTITFCALLRKTLTLTLPPKLLGRRELLGLMAVCLGGIGIWSMHFVGMFSLKLYSSHREEQIFYDLFPTLVSMVVVVLFAGGGLYVASLDPMFGKTKNEIVQSFVDQAQKMSRAEIRRITHVRMLVILCTESLGFLVCGGVISGAGVSVMHYLGMWALRIDDGVIRWDGGVVFLSVIIAVVASTIAFWILFRLLSLYPEMEVLRLVSMFLMAIAVTGIHYTGMMAAQFHYREGVFSTLTSGVMAARIGADDAFYGTLVAAILIGFILFVLAVSEHRHRMFQLIDELKRFRYAIDKASRRCGANGSVPVSFLQELIHSPPTANVSLPRVYVQIDIMAEARKNPYKDRENNVNDDNYDDEEEEDDVVPHCVNTKPSSAPDLVLV